MKRELTLKEKKDTEEKIVKNLFIVLMVASIIAFWWYQAHEKSKKDEAEKIADLASQYTVSGKVEKVTSKLLDNDAVFKGFFYRSTIEYYIWVNSKKYKLPDDFIGALHKGSQVTLVGDRKGVSSVEMEVSTP